MYLLLIFLPLISSFFLLLFGRFLGRAGAAVLSLSTIFFSFLLAIFSFYEVSLLSTSTFIVLPLTWVSVDILNIEWVFLFDSLSATMLLVVFFVSGLVHLYSLEYMGEDPHLIRFMAYLSFFTFFMAILVTAGNFIQMFLGWEGVGLSSYLLINFWFTRVQANKSAFKAMVINRIGDWGLAIGIFLVFFFSGTVDFLTVFSLLPFFASENVVFFDITIKVADLIAFFLFFGVVGKSAQFGLHTWLPDAMEGPTPVSALIHAATMVTAGVFLTIRCSGIFELASSTMFLVSFLGALTAFFGSTVAMFQTDIKKIIAYSTCSQLGYMILACGFSLYSTGLFHFFNHAFFKALLFLSAGSVIHALAGEQDIYNMGSLDTYLPFTAQMMLIGSTALASFPFLSGFYSKDWIIEISHVFFYFDGLLMMTLISQAALFTMLYSDSLARFVFDGDENFSSANLLSVGESGMKIVSSLAILAIPSIFSGFLFKDLFIGFGAFTFADSMFLLPTHSHFFESDFLFATWRITPVLTSFFSIFLVIFGFDFLYRFKVLFSSLWFFLSSTAGGIINILVDFFALNWFFDVCVNFLAVRVFLNFCREISFKLLDKGLLELFGPYALMHGFSFFSSRIARLTSGYIFHYSFLIIFGAGFLLLLNFFIFETLNFEFWFVQIFLLLSFITTFEA
jgi:proton-translocating NADH-quinone oxidoreductase chain L